MYIHVGLHLKYPLFLSDFNDTWIFWTNFRRILKNQIWWNSVQWEPSCSTRTNGQTDRHDENNRNFLVILQTCLKMWQSFLNSIYNTACDVISRYFRKNDILFSYLLQLITPWEAMHTKYSVALLVTNTIAVNIRKVLKLYPEGP
jgi:hypothetical protein